MTTRCNDPDVGSSRLSPVTVAAAVLSAALLVLAGCGSDSDGGDSSSTPTSAASSGSSTPSTSAPAATSAGPTTTIAAGQYAPLALPILDAIVKGDFPAATTNFDSTMKEALSPEKLQSAWADYQQAFGAYQSHGEPAEVPFGDLTVVNTPLQMANEAGEFRVTFHGDGTVAGLYFLKVGVPIS